MLDQKAQFRIGLISEDLKRQLRAEAEARRDEVRPYKARLKEVKNRHAREMEEWKQADLDRQPDEQPSYAKKARRDVQKTAMDNEVQVLKSNQEYVRLYEGLARENQMALDAIFDVSELSGTKREHLRYSLLTDGVSVRLVVETPNAGPKRRRDGSRLLPRRGKMDVEHLREELGVKEMSTNELACVANELNNLGLKEQSNQNQRLDNLLGSCPVAALWRSNTRTCALSLSLSLSLPVL